MMQPPLHMSAIPPMFKFQLNSFATSFISMNPCVYEIIFEAYKACLNTIYGQFRQSLWLLCLQIKAYSFIK